MSEPIDVQKCGDIDLGCHAVIEASAGTGKTYTIENLVVRLLLEKKVSLEKILVVTFTEKATGELRERIRAKIAALVAEPSTGAADRALLKDSLETFDNAPIFTIHGFCHRVLQQYAFENGEPFQKTVEDDAALYGKMLKEQMRKSWKAWFGDDLKTVLELSGFSEAEDRWTAEVMRLAGYYSPRSGDRIVPALSRDPARAFPEFMGVLGKGFDELLALVGKVDPRDPEKSEFNSAYGSLRIQPNWLEPRRRDVILPLLALLAGHMRHAGPDLAVFSRLMDAGDAQRKKGGFAYLIDERMKKRGYASDLPQLDAIVAKLEELRALRMVMPQVLKAVAIVQLKEDVERYKREHGLISYDDMLNLVDRALDSNDILVGELRKRYTYALLDEFQDTDTVQWNVFKTIFLGSAEGNRLFVVGDPKQAIYSFRGADVYAYIGAKDEMLAPLAKPAEGSEHAAKFYSLAVNWRSMPALIRGYNRLFGDGGWFPDEKIAYRQVREPSGDKRITRLYRDKTGRAAITAVDLSAAGNAQGALCAMSHFIAAEIERLVSGGVPAGRMIIGDGEKSRPITSGDICVLVKAKAKARLIERLLDERGIPHLFYKKHGLYRSAEAAHIGYLLAAIIDPTDIEAFKKALLTPFFGVRPADVERYADLPQTHRLKELFGSWFGCAARRAWPRLFRSILEDTGVCYRNARNERRLTNYRHILEVLQTEAASRNLDLVEVLAALNRYSALDDFDDEAFDMQRLETEKPKVRIMTIHAAKGLEFPVVFIADGFGQLAAKKYSVWKYHDDDHRVVYDLVKADANAPLFEAERRRDNRQLYYVALTRAKYKLYIPKFPGTDRSEGPVVYTIHAALERAWPDSKPDSEMLRFVDPVGNEMHGKPPLKVVVDADAPPEPGRDSAHAPVEPKEPFPQAVPSFEDRVIEITSYSGLKDHSEGPVQGKAAPDRSWITYYDDKVLPPKEDDDDEKDEGAVSVEEEKAVLPPGTATGSMLHGIFEEIDFSLALAAPSPAKLLDDVVVDSLFERTLSFYGLLQAGSAGDPAKARLYKEEVARIAWHTLRAALAPGSCQLASLKPGEKLAELEFYYPLPGQPGKKLPEEMRCRDGFLMGYIDLVFTFGGKYYILDWKSNYLEGDYSAESIRRSMELSGYDLQYKVYSIAVVRWLKSRIKDFDYQKHFGGIYYMYLRGMDERRPGQGYFFTRPKDEAEIRSYEDEIFTLVNR